MRMEASQMSTYTTGQSTAIGIEDVRETYDKILSAGRLPVFHCHPLLDNVFYGELVDELLVLIRPGFDPKTHKGFLIPERYRDLIKSLFG